MKRSGLKSILAAVLGAAILAVPAGAAELTFRDVPEDAWYYADVQSAVEEGLVNGRSAEAFCPEENMTAAEAVKLAACMRQIRSEEAVTLENGDPWYAPYAEYAKENGIIDGDLPWDEPISREDYMAIFARALPEEDYAAMNEIPEGGFPDVPDDAPNAAAIYKLARAGIVQGDEKHRINPADPIRRCEVAAILTRMMHAEARVSFTLTAAENTVRASDFTGSWMDKTSGRASLTVMPSEEYPFFDVRIIWGNGVSSSAVWEMKASFDEESGRLTYENGTMAYVNTDENGTGTRDERWTDGAGFFAIGPDGVMSWQDSREERSGEFVLERTVIPAPSPEELTSGWFGLVGGIETGTAGASLKQAQAACEAVGFASRSGIWSADIPALRENLLAAWTSMTEEEQSAFDANFISLLTLVRDAWEDWDANKGPFEDAGVAETMRGFMSERSARLSWDALTANTLTMGNTAGN